MKIYVDLDHVDITEYTQVESGEYNTNKINFIFTPEYKDLVKVAIFGCKLDTDEPKFYKIYLSDDSCYLPSEVTTTSDVISIGVYAFNVDNGELKLRYSPTPVKTIVYEGSFREEAENASSPTPTEIEQIMSRIISLEEITSDLNTRVETLENKACDLDTLKSDVEQLKVDVDDLDNRLDTAESDIDELEGDIANTYSKTEVDTLLGAKVDTTTYTTGQAAQDEKLLKLIQIASQLPTVSGEGTNISLSPTIEYDLEVGSLKGDTTQNTLTGKNLLNYNNLRTPAIDVGFVVDSEGNISDSSPDGDNRGFNYANSNWQMSLEAGTYTMTIIFSKQITSTYGNCRIYDSSDTQLVYFTGLDLQNVSNVSKTFTLSATTNIGIIFKIYSGVCKIQLEKSSSATTWEPYCGGIPSPNPNYPQDIQVVTGTQETKVCDKNLFDKSNVTPNAYINTSGRLVTGATNYTASAYIKVPIGNITWSATSGNGYSLSIYDKDKNFIRSVGRTSNNAMTISIANGEEYIRFTLLSADLNITQIEVGSTATSYSPYTSQTYTLHLGDLELAKIPNTNYVDKIFIAEEGNEVYDSLTQEQKANLTLGKWYKYGAIGKVILNGTENWELQSINSYGIANFRITLSDYNTSSTNLALCDNFSQQDTLIGSTQTEGFQLNTQKYLYIRIKSSTASTVSEFKTWLSTHNTIVNYVLANASTTEITNETLLSDLEYIRTHAMSYSGTTNISTSGNLPIIISASALKQLS